MFSRCVRAAVVGGRRSGNNSALRLRPQAFVALNSSVTQQSGFLYTTTASVDGPLPHFSNQRTASNTNAVGQSQSQAGLSAVAEAPSEDEPVNTRPQEAPPKRPRPGDEYEGIKELRVQIRPESEQGSRGSRKCRKSLMTPGILFATGAEEGGGRGERIFLKTDTKVATKEIKRFQSAFENTLYDLVVEDPDQMEDDKPKVVAKARVMPTCVRIHRGNRGLMNINYIRFKPGRRHAVPIRFINDDLNLNVQKKGAIVIRLRTHQRIILPEDPEKVPRWLDLDLEHVRSGNKMRVRDIILPPGIELEEGHRDELWDEVICTIKGKKILLDDMDPEADPL